LKELEGSRKRGIIVFVKIINFPQDKWGKLQNTIVTRGSILVMRKNLPYGKYKVDDIVRTPWNQNLKVESVESTKNEVKDTNIPKHLYRNRVEIIKLVPVK
jgi:hypothetical protein